MDKIQLGVLIAGAILPFLISLIKRWVVLTKEQTSFLVFLVSFVIASCFQLVETNFAWGEYLSKITEVYATSQLIYWAVLKTLELDQKIETK